MIDLPSTTIDESRKWASSFFETTKKKKKEKDNTPSHEKESQRDLNHLNGDGKKRKKKDKHRDGKDKDKDRDKGRNAKRDIEDEEEEKHIKSNGVVVTDFRTLAERLHEKILQVSAPCRKRKHDSSDNETISSSTTPPKKHKKSKKNHKKNNKQHENGKNIKFVEDEEEDEDEEIDLFPNDEKQEIIHIDDLYPDIKIEPEEDEDYDEKIRRRLLGIQETSLSPELEEDLQYSTFDFSSGKPIPKYLSKKGNKIKRLSTLIKKAERQQKTLSGTNPEQLERAEKITWDKTFQKMNGEKLKDNTSLLKKTLKNTLYKKKKSAKEWKERTVLNDDENQNGGKFYYL